MEKKKVILVWFRNDLRLHDNEVLVEAVQKGDLVIPAYFFDPRYYQTNAYGNKNTGVLRAQFILETVGALKDTLKSLGSNLMTFHGYPEELVPKLVAKYDVDEVFHHREVAALETSISEKVEEALWQHNKVNLRHFIGHTMYHKEDLPFPVRDIPDSFNLFKKKVERESAVRRPLHAPEEIPTPVHIEQTELPGLEELGYNQEEIARVSSKELIGGEEYGLKALESILDPEYSGLHDFSLISPYISTGALSPVNVFHELSDVDNVSNKKRYDRRLMRLLWRDYFRFMLKKHPNVYFKLRGTGKKKPLVPSKKNVDLAQWKNGTTGEPLIDEAMSMLLQTGNLPYDMRAVLGLYMIQETGANWLEGASFFEEHLLDYTPSSNYGYWSHLAGVGTSAKDNTAVTWKEFLKKAYPKGFSYENA